MFWQLCWLLFIWIVVADLVGGEMLTCSSFCLAEWRYTVLVPNVYDVNVESWELMLLHNVPLVSLSDPFLIKAASFCSVCNLVNTSHFCQYLPSPSFPYGFKTSKHAWFSFMLFCTASMMQKNDTRCDAQTSVFLTPKTCFTQYLCGLFSSLSLD